MIKKIKDAIDSLTTSPDSSKIVVIDGSQLEKAVVAEKEEETELRTVGLFSEVEEEKVAELVHALLYLNQPNVNKEKDQREPIEFYLSTYGGCADDMFALYDVMRQIREVTEIHTIGMGKVMSAGVLLLAAGTKGKRKIGKNCRVMIHSVVGGNHGSLHNLVNEMEAIEQLQQMFTDCLISETKITRAKLKNMLERKVNVYLSAEEAIELGIADIII